MIIRANLHATVLVRCPFELAWARVQRRNQGRTMIRGWNEQLLSRMGEYMEEEFRHGVLTGQQWEVNNTGTLEEAQKQLQGYLLPILHMARREELQESGAGGRD
jgi:hypothetical protein